MTTRITLDLDPEMHRALSVAALDAGVPKAALMRALIATYIEGPDRHRQQIDRLAVSLHQASRQ